MNATSQKSTNCCRCPLALSDSSGEPIRPEISNPVGHFMCSSCRAKANAASLAAWRKLSPMEREGARTREERGA